MEDLEKILEEGINAGHFRQVDTRLAITALLAAVRAVINPSFVYAHSLSLDEAFKRVFDLFFFGISKTNEL